MAIQSDLTNMLSNFAKLSGLGGVIQGIKDRRELSATKLDTAELAKETAKVNRDAAKDERKQKQQLFEEELKQAKSKTTLADSQAQIGVMQAQSMANRLGSKQLTQADIKKKATNSVNNNPGYNRIKLREKKYGGNE